MLAVCSGSVTVVHTPKVVGSHSPMYKDWRQQTPGNRLQTTTDYRLQTTDYRHLGVKSRPE